MATKMVHVWVGDLEQPLFQNISYHIDYIVDLKRQSRLKVRIDKLKLKVKVQSVSDDDVCRKDFLKSHVLSWRLKVYSDWEDVTSYGRAFQVFGPAAK